MNVPVIIVDLVTRFGENLPAYQSKGFKEEQLKQEFLNPLFEALGWDVSNTQGELPQHRDVIFEDSIKVGGGTKAPDYCFTLKGKRMFFMEAKKPSVDIKMDTHPAYQLRRYAWSANLPISILSDFEEFAIYESKKKPESTDKANVERYKYYTFKDYLTKWDEIYSLFSKDAVQNGSLDEFIEASKKARGTEPVDQEFLKEIETWRDHLAKNMAKNNRHLTNRYLNYSVQTTIDRILFLRICEDWSIEPYGQLLEFTKKDDIYGQLCKLFKKADDKYNSGLFYFKMERGRHTNPDGLTLGLKVEDNVLKEMIEHLYYPDSPYEFSVLPPEILGNVYEQFLGKKIKLEMDGTVLIEEKPEVKKAGGVYYTPRHIVEYIVKNTIDKICEGKTPNQISKIRIIDPACGSGSFLLGAYEYLLNYHLRYYTTQKNVKKLKDKVFQGKKNEWFLTIKEKKRILLNNIYGVDIDPQAVEVTKLSLLLKVLEGYNKDVFEVQQKLWQERALPDLEDNIKCGNSLIGNDFPQMKFYTEDELYRINLFEWKTEFSEVFKNGGFDAVIGNPPYIQIQKLKAFYPDESLFYQSNYETAKEKNVDIYVPFIERGLLLLKKEGVLGYICPNRFFNSDYGILLRQHLKKFNIYHLVNFRHYFVFKKADTYTCLLFIQKKKQQNKIEYKEIRELYKNEDEQVNRYLTMYQKTENNIVIDNIKPHFIQQEKWYFMAEDEQTYFEKMIRYPPFKNYYKEFFVGVQTSLDKVYILKYIGENRDEYHLYSRKLEKEIWLEKGILKLVIDNNNINSYQVIPAEETIIFPYKIINGNAELYSEDEIKKSFPKTWDYLLENRTSLEDREKGKMRGKNWYAYIYPKNLLKQNYKKILIPHVVKKTIAAIDEKGKYCLDNVGANGIVLKNSVKEHPYYFLAILNSPIATFFISKTSIFLSGGFYATNKQFAGEIPIKPIDFNNATDKKIHDDIVKKVEKVLLLRKQELETSLANDSIIISRQILSIVTQINSDLFDLYGLNVADIRVVERAV